MGESVTDENKLLIKDLYLSYSSMLYGLIKSWYLRNDMRCYIIIYEFGSQVVPSSLIEKIKKYNGWAKISSNSWAILSEKTAAAIRDDLAASITGEDRLFVIRSGTEAAWRNAIGGNEWFKKYL